MTADARCTEHRAHNGRHYLSFVVENPDGHTEEFSLQPSPAEYERLAEHSVDADDSLRVGWVPAAYDDGWAIDWDGLEAYSR